MLHKVLLRRIASVTCAAIGWLLFAFFLVPTIAGLASSSQLVSVDAEPIPWLLCLPFSVFFIVLSFKVSGCFVNSSDIMLQPDEEEPDMPKFARGLKAQRSARKELSDHMSRVLSAVDDRYYKVVGEMSKGYIRGMSSRTLTDLAFGRIEFPAMLTADPKALNKALNKYDYMGDEEARALTMMPISEAKQVWDECFLKYQDDMCAVLEIWSFALGGVLIDRTSRVRSLQSLGKTLGVDLLLDAYLDGVPLEVLTAGHEDKSSLY